MSGAMTLQRVGGTDEAPVLLAIDGLFMDECCCSGDSSSWPGAGTYCILDWLSSTDCETWVAAGYWCQFIESEAEWNAMLFDECVEIDDPFWVYYKVTTDGFRFADGGDCEDVCGG